MKIEFLWVGMLQRVLRLDAETGQLFWLPRPPEMFAGHGYWAAWNRLYPGQEAFTSVDKDGYRRGRLFGRSYLRHVINFTIHHGRWPLNRLDHRNGVPGNDWPLNLREATPAQNCRNRGAMAGSSSHLCGVSRFHGRGRRKWRARCADADGTTRMLGLFATEIEAARAYDRAAAAWHGDFAKLNFPEENHNG